MPFIYNVCYIKLQLYGEMKKRDTDKIKKNRSERRAPVVITTRSIFKSLINHVNNTIFLAKSLHCCVAEGLRQGLDIERSKVRTL